MVRARAQLRREREEQNEDVDSWTRRLSLAYELGLDASAVASDTSHVGDGITLDRARVLARQYLTFGGTETGILLPTP